MGVASGADWVMVPKLCHFHNLPILQTGCTKVEWRWWHHRNAAEDIIFV